MDGQSGLRGRGLIERHVIWGGFSALCSKCGWKRVYRPGTVTMHRLPDEELTETIRAEFRDHKCEEFPNPRYSD